ncbi:MAG: hypothetical protein R3B96_25475 [Pirellulaceae bacterium]
MSGAGLMATLAVGRSLGETGLGEYYIGFPVIVVLMTLLAATISIPYSIRLQAMDASRRKSWLGAAIVGQFSLLSLVVVGMLLVSAGLYLYSGPSAGWFCLSVCLAGIGNWLREFSRRLLLADFRARSAVLLDGTVAGLLLLQLIWLARADLTSVPNVFLAVGAAHGLGALLGAILLRVEFRIERAAVLRDWREAWGLGRGILGAAMLGTLQGWSIPWIVPIVSSVDVNGRYSQCLFLPLLINPLAMGLAAFLSPYYSRARHESGHASMRRLVAWHTAGLSLFVVGLLLLAGWKGVDLVEFAYKATGSSTTWWTLMALTLAHGLQRLVLLPLENLLLVEERTDIVMRSSGLSLVLTVLGVAIATPLAGELGTAVAILVATLLGESIKVVLGLRLLRERRSASPATSSAVRDDDQADTPAPQLVSPASGSVVGGTMVAGSAVAPGASPARMDLEPRVRGVSSAPLEAVARSAGRGGREGIALGEPLAAPRFVADPERDQAVEEAIEQGRNRRLYLLVICIWVAVIATFSPPGRDEMVTAARWTSWPRSS